MRKIIKVGKYLYFFFNYYNHLYHKQKRKMYFLFLFWDFLNIKENYISNFFLVANHIIGASWANPVCWGEVLEGSGPWEGGRRPSLTLSKGKHHEETVPVDEVRGQPYLKQGAWMIHTNSQTLPRTTGNF